VFKNYFKTAFRNLLKNKVFSLINVSGLSIGISSALVMYLIVSYDFKFDKFEKDPNRIYRIVSNFTFSGEAYHNSGVTYPMAKALRNEATGIEIIAPFSTFDDASKVSIPQASKDPVIFKKQEHAIFADENYFNLIPYQWIVGSPKISLNKAFQVVLTETNAALYFPRMKPADIIGKEVIFNDTIRTIVTGVVKDLDQSTDFNFKTFLSRATQETHLMTPEDQNQWDNTNSAWQLFVKLSPGTSTTQIEKQLMGLFKKYHKVDPNDHSTTSYALQPFGDIHFNTDYGVPDNGRVAHKPTLYGLLAVAAFLLLLGCINFINLTTAQASQRAKEIGIRKTMGSNREQLIFQFLSETFLLTLCATILSIIIAPLLLKVFSDFIPEGLHYNLQPGIIVFLFILMIVVSLLSGFYPALVMSSYKPVLVLKNQSASESGKTRNAWMRKTLTVSQFVIAQVFIIGTILVSKQISYTLNADLGFKKDAIIYFHTNYYDTVPTHKAVLVEKLKAIPEIAMICLANDPPTSNSTWTSTMKYKDGKKEVEADVQVKLGDTNYIHLFQMKLLAGTNLPYSDTTKSVIINEAYANFLGFKDPNKAIGKNIEWDKRNVPITGVVANFHQRSLREVIKPLIITSRTGQERAINVALQPQNTEGTTWKTAISKIEKAYKEVYPEQDFDYHFLDETIKKYYTAEQNISKLLMWATGLAIFISSLGLLGLVTYITNQRTKEIGVRKVIGASISQIITLLSKDFLKLVFVAFVIAVPIAWWAGYKWMENFAYKTNINAWIFIAGGAIMFIMALIILCIRTFRAASANPVKSLRTE
jgi:predicted permease